MDYDAIRTGLATVRSWCIAHGRTVHTPRFGAGLAGGDWSVIEQIINDELTSQGMTPSPT